MEWLIIVLYGASSLIICTFSLVQLNLTFHYLKTKKGVQKTQSLPLSHHPMVTIQLPIYNEKYVVSRLLNAVLNMEYPKDRLEIQILDDSTDETTRIIKETLNKMDNDSFDIKHIIRSKRTGYKAGALQYGMEKCSGEFITIFDADFVPEKNFLLKTLPHFVDENIGMIQTKWTHLNSNYGFLTKIQAFWLNAHFTIEQKGREHAGSFINFNGTSGIWRKICIEESGGWQFDTLTEDLDLSYRAQLKGWKFIYKEEIESPAELPILLPAIKSQQYRWNKGGAETARKILKNVLTSTIGWKHKIHAVFHLLNGSVFLLILIAALLSIPMLYIKNKNPELNVVFNFGGVFMVGFCSIAYFYWIASKYTQTKNIVRYFCKYFIAFMIFSMGMTLHNSIAILEGYFGIKTPFVRTPKFNITSKKEWKGNKYLVQKLNFVTLLEGLLATYFVYGVLSGIKLQEYGLLLFHLMMAIGFSMVFLLSIKSLKYT